MHTIIMPWSTWYLSTTLGGAVLVLVAILFARRY
jgi:hypothetical protein